MSADAVARPRMRRMALILTFMNGETSSTSGVRVRAESMLSISSANASADACVMVERSTALWNSVELSVSALLRPSKPFSSTSVSPLMMVLLNLRMMAFLDSSRWSW